MRYLRSTTIKVDLLAGTDIRDACCDVCELSNRLGTKVEFNFNGVIVIARPQSNPLELAEKYREELKTSNTVKLVVS